MVLIASQLSTPASTSELNVPSSAELVLRLMPCARYRTTKRIAADDTTATATGDSPSRIAGRVNTPSTAKAKTRPMMDRRPRQAATRTTAPTNSTAQISVGIPREKSKNV
ncbi:Uncharacterised protein [Mycobacteroides abscessus subsp. abscessus]|nr:Uncharacterised protein [Mycobacteroides abscessus subsp. abscessus]